MDSEKSLEDALAEAFEKADTLPGQLDDRLAFYLGESRKLLPDLEADYDRLVVPSSGGTALSRR